MTTERMKETVSKYVAGMAYVRNVCGKSGGRIVQQDFRQATKLSAIAIKVQKSTTYRGYYKVTVCKLIGKEPLTPNNVLDTEPVTGTIQTSWLKALIEGLMALGGG